MERLNKVITDNTVIKIETERLVLRSLELEDISKDYVDWLNDPAVNKYLSCATAHQTRETTWLLFPALEPGFTFGSTVIRWY